MRVIQFINLLHKKLNGRTSRINVKKRHKRYLKMLKQSNIKVRKLSSEQKKQIDAIYRKYGVKYGYDTHVLTYSVSGKFEAEIMPVDLFRTLIQPALNDVNYNIALSDKGYFELIMPNLQFPECYIKNIEGCFYDKNMNLITEEEARSIVMPNKEVVVKPTRESGSGKGVKLVNTSTEDPFSIHKKNYLVQKRVIQHKSFSELNESSVNIVRIVTLFLDGEVHLVTAALRIGGIGEFTDNTVTKDGKGMIVIGIDENGKLRKEGVFSCGLKTSSTPGGISFLGRDVYKFNEMIEVAKSQHMCFPDVKFIGWDFTVDEDGEIITIEYNLRSPGVLYYQYVNGSLFGPLTERVCEFAKNGR